jgi:hypothetical protein
LHSHGKQTETPAGMAARMQSWAARRLVHAMTASPCEMTGSSVHDILVSAAHPAPREAMAAGARTKGECLTASWSNRLRLARAISDKVIVHG